MNSNWKLNLAICLIASVYVISINCEDGKGTQNETFTFLASDTIKNGTEDTKDPQIKCSPKDLCGKASIKKVTCTGNITAPISNKTAGVDYNCTSDINLEDQKLQWTYHIKCIGDDKDLKNGECGVKISLEDTSGSNGTSHVGLIIGIVVLVVAAIIGVVAFLGYRGIGPMKSFFEN